MPDGSSLPAIPRIREASPETRIVVLTMQIEPAFAREALRAGASGYVLKEAADEELVAAVRAAIDGRSYLNPELAARVASAPPARPAPRTTSPSAKPKSSPDRPRPHQRRDRRTALPLDPHRGDAPGAHPAEAPPLQALRARALRAREGPRRAGHHRLLEARAGRAQRRRPRAWHARCATRAGDRRARSR